jgi:hypothetical protein
VVSPKRRDDGFPPFILLDANHIRFLDGNQHKIPWMVPTRNWAPLFPTHPSMRATSSATLGDRDRRASTAATGRRIVPSNLGPLLEGHGACFLAGQAPGWNEPTRRSAANSGKFSDRNPIDQESAVPNSFSTVADLGRGSRQVVPHLATQPRSLYESRELPKPASVKAEGFSRFLGRVIIVLLSVVGVRKTIA